MLNSCYDQPHRVLPYPESPAWENHAEEVCVQGSHEWIWDEEPTRRQLANCFADLAPVAVWTGSMSWMNKKLSLVGMNQEVLRSYVK